MKKIVLVLIICGAITACGGPKSGNDGSTAANESAKSAESNTDTNANKIGTETSSTAAPGAALMASSDCNTCHKQNEKVIGPALKDIAAKYPATDENVTMLANKVISGGKGNWGEIPMAAHPNLPVKDAKEMVKYILSLK